MIPADRAAPAGPDPSRSGLLPRVVYDRQGELHGLRLLIAVTAATVLLAAGTFVALVAASAGAPEVVGFWVVVTFLAIKLPLLGVLWWLLVRHAEPGQVVPSRRETARVLHALEEQARLARDRPNAEAVLAHLRREAWLTVDRADAQDTPAATAAALRIDRIAIEAPQPPSPESRSSRGGA